MTKIAASQRQEVANMCAAGMTLTEVASRYGVSGACIRSIAKNLGVEPLKAARGPKIGSKVGRRADMGEMYAAGKTMAEVAVAFGVSVPCAGMSIKAAGIQLRTGLGKPGLFRRSVSPDDHSAMIYLYKSGKTLAEVGSAYGVTRERARQILAALGIGRMDGGITMRSLGGVGDKVAAARAKERRRESFLLAKWDMSLADYESHVAEYGNSTNSKSPMHKYKAQRGSAGRRGLVWNFTFADWWRVWLESGKWSQRALSKEGFVMARYGDGDTPYSVETVYICTQSQNSKDSYIVSPAVERFKDSRTHTGNGRGYSINHKSKTNKYIAQFRGKNLGSFPAPELARAAYLAAADAYKRSIT